MITLRPSKERGYANHGWLESYHSFSFANYYDRAHMGYRNLRVINEDWIAPSRGFGTHGHENMEIITYLLDGKLQHKDNTGGEEIIHEGEVQRMSAGTGIMHSEFNPDDDQQSHLLQIWIKPNQRGVAPGYEQKMFRVEEKRNELNLLAAPGAPGDALNIHADAKLFAAKLDAGKSVEYTLEQGRGAWIQIARGAVTLNGQAMAQGDGASVEEESTLEIIATEDAEVLVFDLGE